MTELNKKNIIFISNLHLWSLDAGKGGKAFYHTVKGYLDGGWKVHIISTGGGIPNDIRRNANIFEKSFPLLSRLQHKPVKALSIFARFFKYWVQNKFYLTTGAELILNLSNQKVILYAYEVEAVFVAKKLSVKYKIPLITRFQGTILADVPYTNLNKLRRYPHFDALQTDADIVIMTNDGTQGNRVLERLGNKSKQIVFWRNGVDVIRKPIFRTGSNKSKEKFIFLTVSRLVNWKRVNLAIEGLYKICNDFSNAHLIIVGDGPERKNLENLVRALKIESKVTFKGAVQHSQIRQIMESCDAFLSFYELSNLGNPIMEAMMCGMPIITIDVGDTGELIKNNENGLLIPSGVIDLIPEYMKKILYDNDLRRKLSSAAFSTAKTEFISWDERINKEVALVQKLISL